MRDDAAVVAQLAENLPVERQQRLRYERQLRKAPDATAAQHSTSLMARSSPSSAAWRRGEAASYCDKGRGGAVDVGGQCVRRATSARGRFSWLAELVSTSEKKVMEQKCRAPAFALHWVTKRNRLACEGRGAELVRGGAMSSLPEKLWIG